MGKYRPSYILHSFPHRPWSVHPVWRGIGCVFMVVLPIMAYVIAVILVRENFVQQWVQIPRELTFSINVPNVGQIYLLDILLALVLLVIGMALFTIIYSAIYRLFGPPRYGPLDVPPPKYRKRPR
ncbi:MAG: hypothetical protein IBX69_02135 [Anaerolineales bacterium]|nr:hypothetical protein [Anaerolineales bacterium]